MPPSDGPQQNGNNGLPPNSDQDRQRPDPGEPDSHPFTIAEVKQAKRSGRGIRRLVTLCGTITQVVGEYDRRLLANDPDADSDDSDDDDEEEHPLERREEIRRYVL